MANSYIDEILKEYEKLRYDASVKRDKKVKEIYEKYPEIKKLEEKINNQGIKSTSEILKNPENGEKIIAKMEKEIKKLKSERKKLLSDLNIPENYNEIEYNCEKCKDTGYIDSEKCSCLLEKIREEEYEKSNIGKLIKSQNFDTFSFKYYNDNKNSQGISPLDYIKLAHTEALNFCDNFSDTKNILFYGNSGLGKTFLSSCIAKEIIDKGFYVRFILASRLFSVYDDYKFNRGDLQENKKVIDEAYSCDLLIIDDLGTEAQNQNNLPFLYDILNERILNDKKIIITTNLSIDEMSSRYTPRFISRLYESFKTIKLEGENIRKKL